MWQVFGSFLLLGLVSFGGPAAHIGYFRQEFVVVKQWLSEKEFASLLAMSQALPGPGSSQLGFAIGYHRAGIAGACLAFVGFTLPSMVLMLMFALYQSALSAYSWYPAVLHGLKLLALIVVTDAVVSMVRQFCSQRLSWALCIATAVILLMTQSLWWQILCMLVAAGVGYRFLSVPPTGSGSHPPTRQRQSEATGNEALGSINRWLPLCLFLALFSASFVTALVPGISGASDAFLRYFQIGSLVFGGGHVVLPMLQSVTSDAITHNAFLAGYGAAQAIPGPMFTLTTYLGAMEMTSAPVTGAIVATAGVFLPGFLLVLAVMQHWQSLSARPAFAGVMAGVNSAVTGLLLAAWYQPVVVTAIITPLDVAIVLTGFLLLKRYQWTVWKLIPLVVFLSVLLAYLQGV